MAFRSRSFVLTLMLPFLTTASPAQSPSAAARVTVEPVTTVALLLEGSRASISVLIDGRGPYQLDVDTGFAGEALISKAVAKQLSLKPIGTRSLGDPSGENQATTTNYRLSELKIGSLSLAEVEASEDLPMAAPGRRRDGVVGIALFQKYLLTLDYPGRLLSLAAGDLKSAPPAEVLPFRLDHGIPTITFKLGKTMIEAHVDSGGMGLSIPAEIAKGLPLQGTPVPLGRMRTASNDIQIEGAELAEDAQVARYTISKPFIEINPVFKTAIFGSIPLSNFRVTIDQVHQRIWFQSSAETIEVKAPRREAVVPMSH